MFMKSRWQYSPPTTVQLDSKFNFKFTDEWRQKSNPLCFCFSTYRFGRSTWTWWTLNCYQCHLLISCLHFLLEYVKRHRKTTDSSHIFTFSCFLFNNPFTSVYHHAPWTRKYLIKIFARAHIYFRLATQWRRRVTPSALYIFISNFR